MGAPIRDCYALLESHEKASLDELKKSYQRLIRIHHPDKNGETETFKLIQSAWEILSDTAKRKEYDAEVLQLRLSERANIYCKVTISEMTENGDQYEYLCRCGGTYILAKEDVQHDILLECNECSLNIYIN